MPVLLADYEGLEYDRSQCAKHAPVAAHGELPASIARAPWPVLGVPGTVLTAAILWSWAGLIAVIGPIAAVLEANQFSQLAAQSFMEVDPFTGQLYGNMDSIASQMQAPWFGAVIFVGFLGLVGYLLVSFFVLRGSQVARIIGTVLSGLSIFVLFSAFILGVPPVMQFLLTAAGAVLIWLPASNAFFAAKRAAKQPPMPYYPRPSAGPTA